MNGQFIEKPTAFIRRLFAAQGGLCFHCTDLMALKPKKGEKRATGATREHVFPHATSGKGLVYNIVLAHAGCNGERGDRPPTPIEIALAASIYKKMGIEPFVPQAEYEARYGTFKQQNRGTV